MVIKSLLGFGPPSKNTEMDFFDRLCVVHSKEHELICGDESEDDEEADKSHIQGCL